MILLVTLNRDHSNARYQIRGFKPGTLQINDQIVTQSVIIGPNKLILDWEPQTIQQLKSHHLGMIIELHPNVLIIGTGEKLKFPPIGLYGDLINFGIGVEIMDTAAACRTFNALASEGRNVIAALIIH